jgi:hypothetical protein
VVIVSTTAINLIACTVAALKRKVLSALMGMFVPPVAYAGALRLARPNSYWSRRRYAPGSAKLAKAEHREQRLMRRRRRVQNLIGGRPSEPGTQA